MSIDGDFNTLVDRIEANEEIDLGIDSADDLFMTEDVIETARQRRNRPFNNHNNHQEQDHSYGSFYSFEDR